MAVIVGSARIDENGRLSGGKAGDQTGKEVATEPFYVHKQGWNVLRAKDPNVAKKIAESMLRACNNKNIGYDQYQRLGVITYGTGSTVPTECDCSALVRQCVKEASGVDAGNFTTSNEKSKLLATGLFTEVTFTSVSALRLGDVLVTKTTGHTVVVVDAPAQDSNQTSGIDVIYRVYAGKWYSAVKNTLDYAGVENKPISGVMAKVSKGGIKVRVRPIGSKNYLDWVTGYDVNDGNNGYAGILSKPIDRIQFQLTGLPNNHVKYRVSIVGSTGYLDWVTDLNDYAGIDGKQIDKIQVKIV